MKRKVKVRLHVGGLPEREDRQSRNRPIRIQTSEATLGADERRGTSHSLFTFQDYPDLRIPNTTHSLDGSFKKLKLALGVHAGLSHARKLKLLKSLLRAHE